MAGRAHDGWKHRPVSLGDRLSSLGRAILEFLDVVHEALALRDRYVRGRRHVTAGPRGPRFHGTTIPASTVKRAAIRAEARRTGEVESHEGSMVGF